MLSPPKLSAAALAEAASEAGAVPPPATKHTALVEVDIAWNDVGTGCAVVFRALQANDSVKVPF